MRTAFCSTLLSLARQDTSLMLLTGDLGFTVFEEFRDTLPRQYLNAGVAEQNMIGVAAGLAMTGKRVFVYSIIPFATFRCFEHIRNDVCYHNLPVCIVGVGAGYSYGHMGSTHHAMEDIAAMRSLANMRVICPGDPVEAEAAVRAIVKHPGPSYLRLGKAGERAIHSSPLTSFTIGKALELRAGQDICLMATSTMLDTADHVADALSRSGISVRLLSMHTVQPIDDVAIAAAARDCRLTVTLEEHSRIGGLGSAVAESAALQGLTMRHLLLAAPPLFAERVGSQQYLREQIGLDPASIERRIREKWQESTSIVAA